MTFSFFTKYRVTAYIEIEKHSNIKYEYDHQTKQLVVDRILPYPYFYPFAYGFIPYTKADDQDELDVLILTDQTCFKNTHYDVYIIGALIMEDEKGMDEKILSVLCDEQTNIHDINNISNDIKNDIEWFFSNYKSKTEDRWSKVHGFVDREKALAIYENSKIHSKNL